jgi:glycerate 2-kinase
LHLYSEGKLDSKSTDHRSEAESIFLAGVERVLPDRLISNSVKIENGALKIQDLSFPSGSFKNIFVIGAGKASALMAAEVEKVLGDRISSGHIVVKYGHVCPTLRLKISEAGHPVPDENGFLATKDIIDICRKADEGDLIICLLSGGGSALLWDAPKGIDPDSVIRLNDLLVKSGAAIGEINAVRKHLSSVKGGQLARLAHPATLVSLILSDVVGDPPDVIASGPTVPDPSTFNDALSVLTKYSLTDVVDAEIIEYLLKGISGLVPETPKAGSKILDAVHTRLIGTNAVALGAAAEKALSLGLDPYIIDDRIHGDVLQVANIVVGKGLEFKNDRNRRKPLCLLFGGEPTIRVEEGGSGGRNQHLALLCSVMIRDVEGITILSAGTDGNDGPTIAAGAAVDGSTFGRAVRNGNNPEDYLRMFDSFTFFVKEGGHIITGPTMTNVMDIIVVIVDSDPDPDN